MHDGVDLYHVVSDVIDDSIALHEHFAMWTVLVVWSDAAHLGKMTQIARGLRDSGCKRCCITGGTSTQVSSNPRKVFTGLTGPSQSCHSAISRSISSCVNVSPASNWAWAISSFAMMYSDSIASSTVASSGSF